MKKLLPIAVLLCFFLSSKAQNVKTSTIAWSSTKTMDINLGNTNDEATTLTSYGTTKIEWKNENGSIRKTFQVIEVVGDWSNAGDIGRIQYEVTDGTNSGTITFRKDTEATRVLLVIVSDPVQMTELTIQNTQAQ